jgi:hypothetical protein
MTNYTKPVLASDIWPNAALDTVQDLMEMDTLECSEVELIKALVKWGKFQVQLSGGDPEVGDKLRKKIEPCLKLIRFKALTHTAFAELANNELCNVLSLQEKYEILCAIVLQDWKAMPVQFTPLKNCRAEAGEELCSSDDTDEDEDEDDESS